MLCLQMLAQPAQIASTTWGNIDYDDAPWVQNMSKPNKIDKGLQGRHISLWASHGRFYDQDRGKWRWQRPNLFCTTEDLFTQTIVVPYLIPMLENAGCNVFTPRERDWQKNEIIVDNDGIWPKGMIIKELRTTLKETTGFAVHAGPYSDGENPFQAGTALMMNTAKGKHASMISYVPEIKEAGRYAVYVSYPKMEDALEEVHYFVIHRGIVTDVCVNQRMGYGTWVYIGTFEFDKGESERNCVVISNASKKKGHVGTDAIRFGGGMGNIQREGMRSGFPRFLEGARYYCQWAGAPYEVYSSKQGVNDYADDINTRSLMTNWLGGSSCYMPDSEGLGVPIELSLAVHSDAGYNPDGKSVYGSLAIATTDFNDGILPSGLTRSVSLDLASQLLENLTNDMQRQFGTWNKRYLWDRNYSETRLPNVPSSIIETLSHQSFPDMVIAQHPVGKFNIARSIYKTVTRYINKLHGEQCVIQPLAPRDFHITLHDGKVKLSWTGVVEHDEPSSKPTSYNIYTSIGNQGFDNGQNVNSNNVTMRLLPDMVYRFRITACNDGGESFPTETLAAYVSSQEEARILVVDGFERLAAPYIINGDSIQGFDIATDEGVQRGTYPGWSGYQQVFNMATMGLETSNGLGYSGTELEGHMIAGNNFNNAVEHVEAIASAKKYSVVSTSLSALDNGLLQLKNFNVIDLAFGLQKDDGQLGLHYKTFAPATLRQMTDFARRGGALMTSGAFVGSDLKSDAEKAFAAEILGFKFDKTNTSNAATINGLGMQYGFYNTLNNQHFAATHPENISPVGDAICTMTYGDGSSAAVGYKGNHSCFTMGFPFECIKDKTTKNKLMQGIIAYLLK